MRRWIFGQKRPITTQIDGTGLRQTHLGEWAEDGGILEFRSRESNDTENEVLVHQVEGYLELRPSHWIMQPWFEAKFEPKTCTVTTNKPLHQRINPDGVASKLKKMDIKSTLPVDSWNRFTPCSPGSRASWQVFVLFWSPCFVWTTRKSSRLAGEAKRLAGADDIRIVDLVGAGEAYKAPYHAFGRVCRMWPCGAAEMCPSLFCLCCYSVSLSYNQQRKALTSFS